MGKSVWVIDNAHSLAEFSVEHMMIATVKGRFTQMEGRIEADPADIRRVLRGQRKRRFHQHRRLGSRRSLRSADFFDAENYPTLTFKSTKIEPAGDGYKMTGELTIRGVTRPVTFDLEFEGTGKDPGATRRSVSRPPRRSTARTSGSPGTRCWRPAASCGRAGEDRAAPGGHQAGLSARSRHASNWPGQNPPRDAAAGARSCILNRAHVEMVDSAAYRGDLVEQMDGPCRPGGRARRVRRQPRPFAGAREPAAATTRGCPRREP